jgi:hypothetical protein
VIARLRPLPDFHDQVPRRLAFEQAHPEVRISYLRPAWQGVITLPDGGEQVVTRYELRLLLDALELRLE